MLYRIGSPIRYQLYKYTFLLNLVLVKRLLILCGLLGLAVLLYAVDPEQSRWMPRCLFHQWTGLACPACGTQRAVHHLLHGHIREAVAYNPFLLVSMPYIAALIGGACFDGGERGSRLKAFCEDRRVVGSYLVLIIAWWIGRNVVG